MDGATLSKAMLGRLALSRYNQLAPGITEALARANCTTVNRAAMFCAQVGTESGGLQWMEELASGAEYEGRKDLGNTRPGDGVRFKGRGPIQITGRNNYTKLSQWAHSKGYVPTATYFVDNPAQLSSLSYVWLGPVWYWTVARNMNAYADKSDIRGATLAVNGGTNGLADRTNRWNVCRSIGSKLLTGGAPVVVDYTADLAHWFTAAQMKLWQKKIGTDADGVVGINTLEATQKFLGVHVDGIIGPDTIRALQKWAGMIGADVDGDLGPKTRDAVLKKLGSLPVAPTTPKPAQLKVDGLLGSDTIKRWQQVCGTPADGKITGSGSALVKFQQKFLNSKGITDKQGHKLAVDGVGIYDNTSHATKASHTQEALQKYWGMKVIDGVFSHPSDAVKELQRRLNASN